jgi:hypothetical protein
MRFNTHQETGEVNRKVRKKWSNFIRIAVNIFNSETHGNTPYYTEVLIQEYNVKKTGHLLFFRVIHMVRC